MKGTIRRLFGRTSSEQCANIGDLVDDVPRGEGTSSAQGRDDAGRQDFERKIQDELGRRKFMRSAAVGAAGAGILGLVLSRQAGGDLGDGQGGTHIDPNDIVAKRIAGIRIATEFDAAKHTGLSGDRWSLTALTGAAADLPNGGMIIVPNGWYDLGGGWTLPGAGYVVQGMGRLNTSFQPENLPTRLVGDVIVQDEHITFREMHIDGDLTLTSNVGLTRFCHYFTAQDLTIIGTVSIIGRLGATDAQVPFTIIFVGGEIANNGIGNLLALLNEGASGGHIYFYGTEFHQLNAADLISWKGQWNDVKFDSVLFLDQIGGVDLFDFALSPVDARFWAVPLNLDSCDFELTATDTLFNMPVGINAKTLHIYIRGGIVRNGPILYADHITGGGGYKTLRFSDVVFTSNALKIGSDVLLNQLLAYFDGCHFDVSAATFTQGGSSKATPILRNCHNFNPVGFLATPLDNTNNLIGYVGTLAPAGNLTSTKVYNCVVTALNILASGGTVSAVAINGQTVPYNSSGIMYRVEPGDTIAFTFSGAPTVVVFAD